MKKAVCLLLFAALLISGVPSASAEAAPEPDQPSSWAAETVEEAIALGMVPEQLQGSWQQDLTRGEFARLVAYFLAVQYGYGAGTGFYVEGFWSDYLDLHPDPNGQPFDKANYCPELAQSPDRFFSWDGILNFREIAFSDLEPGGEKEYINFAYLVGIVKGRGDGIYDPDGIITRQEAAALLARTYRAYAELEEPPIPAEPFSDSEDIAPWAAEDAAIMQAYGVFQGYEDRAFRPNGHFTREQGIVTLMRLYQNMPVSRYNGALAPLLSYADVVERCRTLYSADISFVEYEAETEICTVLYVGYAGVMHPPKPKLFLIYPDSTFKQMEFDAVINFQLVDGDTRLTFEKNSVGGHSYSVDLRTGAVETIG